MPRAEEPTAARMIVDSFITDSVVMPICLLRSTDVTPLAKVVYLAIRYNANDVSGHLIASLGHLYPSGSGEVGGNGADTSGETYC
jgi:hypothetical protein